MEQYSVPQFIEAEAKINPFLTFRQFFILTGGGSICLAIYYIFPFFIFVFLAAIVVFAVVLLGFLKIDNMPVATILFNFVRFSRGSKNYTWQKKESSYPLTFIPPQHIKDINDYQDAAQNNRLNAVKGLVELRKR